MFSFSKTICSWSCLLLLAWLGAVPNARAQSNPPAALTVAAGRPLHVALDARTRIRRVGQLVTGHVVEPVFAYDRLVIPAGTPVTGRVAQLVSPSTITRLRAIWRGDFSPHRGVVLRFDDLALNDGRRMPIATSVIGSLARPRNTLAPPMQDADAAAQRSGGLHALPRRALTMAKARVHGMVHMVTAPGKWQRVKIAAISQLPYHPQYLDKGTLYTAQLSSPLDFGEAVLTPISVAMRPAPGSILNARLVTPIDSRKTPRGTPIDAVVTEPVFSSDHRLIYPEGTRLTGEVTFAKPARRFHRNGQLRFLFERVQAPTTLASTPLLASLHGVETSADDRVRVDDEGGTSVSNTKRRFVAPALAVLSLRRAGDRDEHDQDAGQAPGASASGRRGGSGIGAFIGLRVSGLVLNRLSPQVGVALTVLGVVRTVYTNILARGKDVDFPVDTPIQLQLAPARK